MRFLLWPLAAALLLAPTAAACNGLSPGDQLEADGSLCTLAFVLANPSGLYFATAGHCLKEGAEASNPDVGEFGVAVFSVDNDGPGKDFALIRVHPEVYDKLNPAVCGWGGPSAIYEETPGGGGVRHYGHGLLFGSFGPTTQQRQGENLWTDLTEFTFVGAGVPGDSGSAVISADGRALGVLTHVGLFPGTQATNAGTHLLKGLAMAEEKGFRDLRLVLEGEDPVAVLQSLSGSGAGANETGAEPEPTGPTPDSDADASANETGPVGNETAPDGNATSETPPAGSQDPLVPAADVQGDHADEANQTPLLQPAVLAAILALVALRRGRRGRTL